MKNILTNPRYRGCWQYGVTESVWISSKDYSCQKDRPEPLKEVEIEELRIVSDPIWFAAQKRLGEDVNHGGRLPKDSDRRSRPKVLNGLLKCPEHNRSLHVGGPNGRSMFCQSCRQLKPEKRHLFTYLNRALAVRLTCDKLAELVRADEELVTQIIEAFRREVETLQKPGPARIKELETQVVQLGGRIQFVMSHVGDSAEDRQEAEVTLTNLRQQRIELHAELSTLKASNDKIFPIPSEQEVREQLDDLGNILTSAAQGEMDDESDRIHAIIADLTGGQIELFQMGERKAQRGWLKGRFYADVVSVAIDRLSGFHLARDGSNRLEVVIDYREPLHIDAQADEAIKLWDEGLLNKQIAVQMGCNRSYVTKLIHHWFDSRNLPRPDGRQRRAQLDNKQVTMPAYKELSDEVVQLVEAGKSNLAIAKQLKTSDVTVAKAIGWWYQSRDMKVPTAADRRLKKLQQAKELYDGGMLIKDIAAELDYTPRGLKLALDKYLKELGDGMSDGRARRGNANAGESASGHASRGEQQHDDVA